MVSLLVPMPQIPRRDFSWIDGLYDGFKSGQQDALDGRTNDALTQAYDGANGTAAPAGGVLSQLGQKAMQGLGLAQAPAPQAAPVQTASLSSLAPQAQPAPAANIPAAGPAASKPFQLAASKVGLREVPDRAALKDYLTTGGANLDPATTAWCAAFVNSTLAQSGMKGTGSNMARSFLNYGEAVDAPQQGDLAVFSRGDPKGPFGHVGFFDKLNPDGTVRVLGGNQGDAVSYANYPANRLLGYRRPTGGAPTPTSGTVTAAAGPDEAALASAQPVGADFRVPGSATPERPQMQQAQYQPPLPQNVLPTPTLPPQAIRALLANPRTRQQGLSLWREQVGAPVDTEERQFDRSLRLDDRDYRRSRDTVSDQRFEQQRAWETQDAERARQNRLDDYRTQKEIDQQYAAPGAPKLVDLYDEATGQPYKAQWNPQTGEFERVGGIKAPSGTQLSVGPDGQVSFTQGSGMKPLTEGQSKDTVYATRARGSLPTIDAMGTALTNLPETVGGQIPGVGNYLKSSEFQQAEQAGREFLQAILRKDTGAAITSQEIAEYGSVYLPRPGDSPETLKQKQVSRQRALLAIEAGMPPDAMLQQERALAKTEQATGQPAQAGATPAARPRARNPQTGAMIEWNGSAWVPAQ